MDDAYDVVVIGGGAVGEVIAGRASTGGLSTVLIESNLVGGQCSYWACIPTKTLLRPGKLLKEAQQVPGVAPAVRGSLDVAEVLEWRDANTSEWRDDGQVKWLANKGVELVRGRARLTGPKQVEVDTGNGVESVRANKAVVLATGSSPAVPPIDGLDDIRSFTNVEITEAEKVPRQLAILGAGPVGMEMAQAWRWLGSEEVTVIERGDPTKEGNVEPFAVQHVFDEFREMGIRVLVDTEVSSFSRDGGEFCTLHLTSGESLQATQVLLATGRAPNTQDLGLESVGIDPEAPLNVDEFLRVTNADTRDWLYAVGDVNGRALFTHQGKYEARIAADHMLGRGTKAKPDAIPGVIFTDPEIGMVGLTESEARQHELTVRAVSIPLGVAAASVYGKTVRGGAKFIVDEERQVLVGATFVGPGAGEWVHAATIAIVGEVPLEKLWHAVPSFPTFSELWLRFLEEYGV